MNRARISLIGFALALCLPALAAAQQTMPVQANPTPGCTTTAAQLEATKKVALDFANFTGEAKVALADPTYQQHNPASHKRAAQANMSDYEDFKKTFLAQAAAAGAGAGRGSAAAGPQPPAGNRMEIVVAECDIVTVIHKIYLQDPTETPGTFFAAYTFDAYRVKNGKVVEHWDNNVIAAPAGRGQ